MNNKIGIDAGGTFTKIVYEEKSKLHFKTFLNDNLKETSKWIHLLFPNAKKIITGGKAGQLSSMINNIEVISEFAAAMNGVKYLLYDEFKLPDLEKFIIIIIGTGTSILLVENNQQTRITGTGIGGGTFIGLGSLLTGINDYHQLVELSHEGNRKNIDLMVSDIYESMETPIPGDLTASNFAKAFVNKGNSHSDIMASLINMIAEAICLLILQTVQEKEIQHVACIGGALKGNAPLQKALEQHFQFMKLHSYFPSVGQFAGAIGALYT